MLIPFFLKVREYQVPASIRELLDLLAALKHQVVFADMEDFYHIARVCLVKDESHFDRFDRAFADYFKGIQSLDLFSHDIPDEWLQQRIDRLFTEEEKEKIKALGGLDKLMETLKERLEEQKKRHEGGNKWIGTGGTSPFGAYGYNPEGVRIGQEGNRNFSAAKVWDERQFKNLANDVELGTRNIKVALRKLRQFARTGAADELDLDETIGATARNAGMLDICMVPERHNAVKVLLFFDIGGSMDSYIEACEELFSACSTEFKHLEYFYFHNCVYDYVWKDNARRKQDKMPLWEVIHKYGSDYKLIFVGDATMGPYEITYPGGSVEFWNEEAGAVWMQRLLSHFKQAIWLNPQAQQTWDYYQSIAIMRKLMEERMYPLTMQGLNEGIKSLT